MEFPEDLRYTKSHEWAKQEGNAVRVGISAYAQKELQDVVFVELPAAGTKVTQGKPCAVVESVKAAFDIYAPISGVIKESNQTVVDNPEIINGSPYGEGWFFSIEATNASDWEGLLDADSYKKMISEGENH